MNKVEQFCGQCAVATAAKDKMKKKKFSTKPFLLTKRHLMKAGTHTS